MTTLKIAPCARLENTMTTLPPTPTITSPAASVPTEPITLTQAPAPLTTYHAQIALLERRTTRPEPPTTTALMTVTFALQGPTPQTLALRPALPAPRASLADLVLPIAENAPQATSVRRTDDRNLALRVNIAPGAVRVCLALLVTNVQVPQIRSRAMRRPTSRAKARQNAKYAELKNISRMKAKTAARLVLPDTSARERPPPPFPVEAPPSTAQSRVPP
mmetsp:Transcript_14194/g.26054  ORF Transcript_14194/g.26054 Transcript_14194/m.26054 type:complete len:219 (-) Transcript_14194:574-1230(-)